MNSQGSDKAPTVKKLLRLAGGLALLLLLLFIAGNYPYFIETCYTGVLYRAISFVWHLLLSWVPFSTGDVFYTAVILFTAGFLWKLVGALIGRRYRRAGFTALKLLIALQMFIAAFYLLWGMNYFRPPAAKILSLPDSSYSFSRLQTVTQLLIDSANANRALLSPSAINQDNDVIYRNAVLAVKQLGQRHKALQSFYPTVKPSLFTPVINFMGTAGYFNPFSSEAQMNYAMPVVDRPVTACHEMAHQIGFAREDEANFIGFLAGEQSPDRLLRYSAYYMAVQEFMHQVYRRDTVVYHRMKASLLPAVQNDIKAEREYWMHYQNQMGYLSSLLYDRFLKINNQPEGLRTYNRMINLTMAYYERRQPLLSPSPAGRTLIK